MENTEYECVVVGGGPAGYTAALYLGRAGVHTLLLEGDLPGGQLTQTTLVENYPGYEAGVEGHELMDRMRTQAARFGADISDATATAVDLGQRPYCLTLDSGATVRAPYIVIATGAKPRRLGALGEEKLLGRGVSTCATCDGALYRNRAVCVVGGGDVAAEEALHLATICSHVTMVVRRNALRATKVLRNRIAATDNIGILYSHKVAKINGETKVADVSLRDMVQDRLVTLATNAVFVCVGTEPQSSLFAVALDKAGYIVVDGEQRTNVAGVYAAGDVCDARYRQAVVAAASGCRAALSIIRDRKLG